MADWLSLWVPEAPADPHERLLWMEALADQVADEVAERLTAGIREALNEFADSLPEVLTASGDYGAFDVIYRVWDETVDGSILPLIERGYREGASAAVQGAVSHQQIPAQIGVAYSGQVPLSTTAYLGSRQNMMRGVGTTLFNQITGKVASMVGEGMSTMQIRNEIQALGQFSSWRADAIARTEGLMALDAGQMEGDMLLGEFGPVEKSWDSTLDFRTRESHRAMDRNRTVPFGQPFVVGASQMMTPRDPMGPPGEVINCRCVMQRYWSGDKRPDGTTVP